MHTRVPMLPANHIQKIYRKYGMTLHRTIYESPDERLACVRELSEHATLRPSPYELDLEAGPAAGLEQANNQA